jgi:hypothetical protein
MSADYVIAKGTLAALCRRAGKQHATFDDFYDVRMRLSAWLSRKRAGSARPLPSIAAETRTQRAGQHTSLPPRGK